MASWLKRLFGITVMQNLKNIYQQNGGSLKSCFNVLYRTDDLKFGRYMGTDQFGNKYFENPYFFFGRNRWVVYSKDVGLNYDASQVPAEWFGWLHYRTDYTPCEEAARPVYKWMADHSQNLTATSKQYVPYSSTAEKIEAWQPCQKNVKKMQINLEKLDVEAWQNRREKEAATQISKSSEMSSKNSEDLQPKL